MNKDTAGRLFPLGLVACPTAGDFANYRDKDSSMHNSVDDGEGMARGVNFTTLDLNLLRVFDAIIVERSVTRAGERLNLSQPAVSRALSQLRYVFKDKLFVRSGGAMIPTPLAIGMAADIHRILQQLRNSLTSPQFIPAESTRCFNIACGDYANIVLMPFILNRLVSEAPGVQLRLRHFDADDVKDLDEGNIDLIISDFRSVPERFDCDVLIDDELVGIVRKGNPLDREVIDEDALANLPYVAVDTIVAYASPYNGGLQMLHGVEQWTSWDYHAYHAVPSSSSADTGARLRVTVPTQLAAIMLIGATDYVALLPRRVVRIMAAKFDLRSFELTATMPHKPFKFSIGMLWHRMQRERPHVWLRDLIRRAALAAAVG